MLGTVYQAGFGYRPIGTAHPDGRISSGSRELGRVGEDGTVTNSQRGGQSVGRVDSEGLIYRGDSAIGRVDQDGLVHSAVDRFSPVGHVAGEDSGRLESVELSGAAALLLLGSDRPLSPL